MSISKRFWGLFLKTGVWSGSSAIKSRQKLQSPLLLTSLRHWMCSSSVFSSSSLPPRLNASSSCMDYVVILTDGVRYLLKEFKPHTAPGSDGMCSNVVKFGWRPGSATNHSFHNLLGKARAHCPSGLENSTLSTKVATNYRPNPDLSVQKDAWGHSNKSSVEIIFSEQCAMPTSAAL